MGKKAKKKAVAPPSTAAENGHVAGNGSSAAVYKDVAPDSTTPNFELRGMQKWISNYKSKRPGVEVLQRQIDQWMADYDARELQAKKDREAADAEDGWTVVVAKTGRKKTTDDSGIAVGAVSAEAAEDRGNKKRKKKENSALDFYRFQRHEARRNELLELQQRFEEDKKRVARLKAARKFRPF
ncbi:uncharacterized protein [Physcomitrium patens]|uniref:Ribosomal RNA-processing protein 7 C-terminal domain-containing protein n=1 Tax=Physcomitrium patens TaxID=3218 RepID=A9RW61_PHYPA|nr:ribosomal RNA-processing protein 7 homolog A-like [Physcomitrium patens]PNR47193.1 hypothetical protein PHYPA_014313 [Physcomitrium patens]|eukprot:XP_024386104.1 ribosomal RNA-processing protein 7 homolog A-like [Physcomitrella patens]